MAKGQKKSAYLRYTGGKTELQNYTVGELNEIIEGLCTELRNTKSELRTLKNAKKESSKSIKLSEEDYNLLMTFFSKKLKRRIWNIHKLCYR